VEDNIGERTDDIEHGHDFLDTTPGRVHERNNC
jgi:hypothetical protein